MNTLFPQLIKRKAAVLYFGILTLGGCASGFSDLVDLQPVQSVPPVTDILLQDGPRFDDRSPPEWGQRKPWHYTVHGIDVSKYQQTIDWPRVRSSSISFAYIKATEGGDRVDDYFQQNWEQAKQAGISRGAYHFYYFCRSAKEQARWFIRNVPRDEAALPPVLDMEWNHHSSTCRWRPPAKVIHKEMTTFLTMLEKYYGKRPIVYTTVDFFEHNGLNQFRHYPFWLRSVASHPEEKYGNHPWIFWQYTGTGTVPGIKGDTDINVFAGNQADWLAWLNEEQH